MTNTGDLHVHSLGVADYVPVWQKMSAFTDQRDKTTPDQLWLVEHNPVFTQGQAGKPEHLLESSSIPLVQTDRGGQVTYHGPGQLIVYPLIDLRRRGLGVRDMISLLENSVIELLKLYDVQALARADAPGVYVGNDKIASLGLRVRKGCCFHGVSINIDMDLSPFGHINPCGYPGLAMTQLAALSPLPVDIITVASQWVNILAGRLSASIVYP